MSIEQKIVYAGLSRMTKDRTVIQNAFQYWQEKLSGNAFDVVDVTAKLVSYLGLDSNEKKVLMIGMHAASNKAEIELDDVPGYIAGGGDAVAANAPVNEPESSSVSNHTPHYQITHGYIKLIIEGVRRKSAGSFNEMDEILKDESIDGVSSVVANRVKDYGFSEEMLSDKMSEGECRDLAHQLYLLVIDVIGPVSADIVVNGAIDKLLTSDASSRFDPRSLI